MRVAPADRAAVVPPGAEARDRGGTGLASRAAAAGRVSASTPVRAPLAREAVESASLPRAGDARPRPRTGRLDCVRRWTGASGVQRAAPCVLAGFIDGGTTIPSRHSRRCGAPTGADPRQPRDITWPAPSGCRRCVSSGQRPRGSSMLRHERVLHAELGARLLPREVSASSHVHGRADAARHLGTPEARRRSARGRCRAAWSQSRLTRNRCSARASSGMSPYRRRTPLRRRAGAGRSWRLSPERTGRGFAAQHQGVGVARRSHLLVGDEQHPLEDADSRQRTLLAGHSGRPCLRHHGVRSGRDEAAPDAARLRGPGSASLAWRSGAVCHDACIRWQQRPRGRVGGSVRALRARGRATVATRAVGGPAWLGAGLSRIVGLFVSVYGLQSGRRARRLIAAARGATGVCSWRVCLTPASEPALGGRARCSGRCSARRGSGGFAGALPARSPRWFQSRIGARCSLSGARAVLAAATLGIVIPTVLIPRSGWCTRSACIDRTTAR